MWGDLKVWTGNKEVVVLPWWGRVLRWFQGKNSKKRYMEISEQLYTLEELDKKAAIHEALMRAGLTESGEER